MLRNTINITCIVVTLMGIAGSASASKDDEPVISISLTQLIVEPTKYEGMLVSLKGYIGEFSDFYLFLTKDHALLRDSSSSIAIDNPDFRESVLSDYCGGSLAEIWGRVTRMKGGWGQSSTIDSFYLGDLRRIFTMKEGEPGEFCWKIDQPPKP